MREQTYKVEVTADLAKVRTLDLVVVLFAKVRSKCLISKPFYLIEPYTLA